LKLIVHLLALLASSTVMTSAQLLLNPGFETPPFPASWTNSGAVTTAGLNSTPTAARLSYNTISSLGQTLSTTATDFTADLSFQIPGNNEAQAFRVLLDAGADTAIDIRTATGGVLQLRENGIWKPLYRITDYATFNVPANTTVRLRVIGRNFGTPSAAYDLVWSDPGGTALSHAATGLTAFAATTAPFSKIMFTHDVLAGNSFTVDDVTVTGSAIIRSQELPRRHRTKSSASPASIRTSS
jgi:hypothetical protein